MQQIVRQFILITFGVWLGCGVYPSVSAQGVADSIRTLSEVTVSSNRRAQSMRSATPAQMFDRQQIERFSAWQLSDAVKHFAGVTVKDYGGIGGLKTVSIRSLGAQHTAVSYDGIGISDVQTGQIDIGRFALDHVDQLSLSNGQSHDIFRPARLFAAAGILDIRTLTPDFKDGKTYKVRASLKGGSWGLLQPAIRWEQKLNRKLSLSLDANLTRADGNYPYTLYYGSEGDSTSRERRQNTDVRTCRMEAGLYAQPSETSRWDTKLYYYDSSRGLPSATTFYYHASTQHLWERNMFVQSHYTKELGRQWAFQTSAKWNGSYQRYLDTDSKSQTGKTENRYFQQEYYLTTSLLYRTSPHLSLNLSTDGSLQHLRANLTDFAQPTRYSWLTVLAAKYVCEQLTASASVLATVVHEDVEQGAVAGNHQRLSPYVGLTFQPFADHALRIRAFAKQIFRMPTFNDLYYNEVGNVKLRPENAQQYNFGLTYALEDLFGQWTDFNLTIDTYYNKVSDKILATPTKNIFIWSMVNLGKVDITGVDATASVVWRPCADINLHLSGSYTYQRALDVTDPAGKTYKQQIAYTPRVSGSGQAALETPWGMLTYAVLYSGKRYALGQNLAENRLKAYTDHSIAVQRNFHLRHLTLKAGLEVLNLMNENYEIVRYFPMPGRSIRATINLNY